ncbi:MAG TPA: hypothetical protein VMM78_16070 [Thermomicrobiales bacterium]|nr:hypothetical protein [Thermomicrobiales bacterium]
MPNKNAKVIIPLVVGVWLLGIISVAAGVPPAVRVAVTVVFVVTMFVGIPTVVFYLMAEQGWSTLAKRFRSTTAFTGAWQRLPTVLMAMVRVDHPEFQRNKLRLHGALRVGTTAESLHLSMLFSKIPILGARFFPDVQIPWSAVSSAKPYEAPGGFRHNEPGNLLQVNFDPNYTGTFVELEVGEPPVFIQLPEHVLGDLMAHMPQA